MASRTKPYGLVLALDGDGNVLSGLHDPGGERVRHVTSVEPRDGWLYLGSIEADAVARVRP